MANDAVTDKRLTIIDFITQSILVLMFSLMMSIIIEWCGMAYYWDHSSSHALQTLEGDLGYINDDFTEENILGYRPIDIIDYFYSTFHQPNEDGSPSLVTRFVQTVTQSDYDGGLLGSLTNSTGVGVKEYILAALYVMLSFVLRLAILTLSIPLVLVVVTVGLVDGLVFRDLRRWQNGQESAFKYHYGKKMLLPSLFFSWFLYLSIPFSINPSFVIVPMAIISAYIARETAHWFKKYL
ncbi:TIGR03747 family integrating conjugative element membrane protein [Moritella sp. F3]|uniref:TIGR03747 family integrating conjugative element membrane protein n=1 Tax=Moritella sp. F3 TaxID=2718882 RepID=UPI0018E1B855|nr:TIGR03747 family integrating conjugative element membrane protein [Moritella sp. F3]GIC77074.1 integrating conjugative element membrane protein [Moritella sp. F1]GIC82193.1 integrating conjugative element membrane protein [Moritella sp. F3]